MKVEFNAWEYDSDDSFKLTPYSFEGSTEKGWLITRNQQPYLKLGKGYELLKSKYCGICSTDLSRRFLPFPLPQITGHEVVATSLDGSKNFVVEINDSFSARGDELTDAFCQIGIPTHSPSRMVLGIDRLPGGFGPYLLAPIHSAIELKGLDPRIAVLIEPFAASLQAILSSPPKEGDRVAVLGPRRLGNLIIAALHSYRNSKKINFSITAIARHDELLQISKLLGADTLINSKKENLNKEFDLVYDTTSTEEGFLTALKISKKEIHLKTTNGKEMAGLKKLTELVVDELSILPYSNENLNFDWKNYPNKKIICSKNFTDTISGVELYRLDSIEAEKVLESSEFSNRLPRFDLGIATSLEEIDSLIRPNSVHENSLIRPRGAILFKGDSNQNPLLDFLNQGGRIRSSRCGEFEPAIELLKQNPKIANSLLENLITDFYDSDQMNEAYARAKESNAVKVIVEHK
jgi:threonine dehydrogenase-like Zn-dependent dehydrogenase